MTSNTQSEERREYPGAKPWERHVQTILTALVFGGIMWLANTTNDNKYQIGIMIERVSGMTEKLDDLKLTAGKRFTKNQGAALVRRVGKLEDLVNDHIRNTPHK